MKRLLCLWLVVGTGCGAVDGVNGENGVDGVDGEDGTSYIIDVVQEAAGLECPNGGQRILIGEDLNDDNQLAPLEIMKQTVVCTGADPDPGLVVTAAENPGENCVDGGVVIRAGQDEDRDGLLSIPETKTTSYVCNGVDGENGDDGLPGRDGLDGDDGINGTNGTNGLNSLVATVAEAPGTNCVAGGVRITTGLDTNRNNILDAAEVTASRYVCNGSSGSTSAPIVVNATAPAPHLYNGDSTTSLVTASLTAPGPGTVVATASADLFCDTFATTSATYCATGNAEFYAAISPLSTLVDASAFMAIPAHFYGYLAKDVTNNVHVTQVFTVSSAGNYTYYFRGRNYNSGKMGAYRQRLTLVYLPN